jgi:hypothetical protein
MQKRHKLRGVIAKKNVQKNFKIALTAALDFAIVTAHTVTHNYKT